MKEVMKIIILNFIIHFLFSIVMLDHIVMADDNVDVEAETNIEDKSAVQYGVLKFSIAPSYMTVVGKQTMNGSVGTLNSELMTAYGLSYNHNYDQWLAGIESDYKRVKFQQSDDHFVDHANHTLRDLNLYLGRAFSKVSVGIGFGQTDKILYKSLNGTFVEVEKRTLKKYFLYTEAELYKSEDYSSHFSFQYGVTSASLTDTYHIEQGSFYKGNLGLDYKVLENKKIGIDLFYKNYDYKTKQLELNSSEVGIGLTFSFGWGTK